MSILTQRFRALRTSKLGRAMITVLSLAADDPVFAAWLDALTTRALRDLTFPEVARALRSLSAAYVEQRQRLREGRALSGEGKRAAFALFYGPLHYLLIREIVAALPRATERAGRLVDLGCGTGTSGAAWARQFGPRMKVVGIDRHPWAVDEARRTYNAFGLDAGTNRADLSTSAWPKPPALMLAAFAINELDEPGRDRVLTRLLKRATEGDRVLIVEPLAGFVAPWWSRWRDRFAAVGGRTDEWRFKIELPRQY